MGRTTPGSDAAGGLDRGRAEPERITLGVAPGVEPSSKPPVRIYLGSQGAQFRAERVFVWSVERVRDPRRIYEIYIMRELAGFDRRHWTTGFTNYRFAIAAFARAEGRAIWNDVDQIYLADPAELFDTDMRHHGFLAIAPDSRVDTAVMLIDCARMAEVWTLDAARRQRKKALIVKAVEVPGLRGDLDHLWHARDEKEYVPGQTKCLHYTTLHTQPWRPVPERFIYQEHPLAGLWHELESEADAAGFHHFNRRQPTARYREIGSDAGPPAPKLSEGGDDALVDRIVAELAKLTDARSVTEYRPFHNEPPASCDALVCRRGLERVPEDDLPWVLDDMFNNARRFVCVAVDCESDHSQSSPTFASLATESSRWPRYLEAASGRYPEVHWELIIRGGEDSPSRHWGGRFVGSGAPRVWVLADDAPGQAESALGLAEALGWPYERRQPLADVAVRDSPDLVIAAGPQAAKHARRLRRDTTGRMRTVQLGARAGAPLDDLDLVVAPVTEGIFPNPHLFETATPLATIDAAALEVTSAPWREAFERAAAPRTAAIVDGPGVENHLTKDSAACIGADLARALTEDGGSLFVLAAASITEAELAALSSALPSGVRVERAAPGRRCDAYLAYLALADDFIIMGDSEQTAADVCTTGKPVRIYPASKRPRGPIEKLRGAVLALALAPRANDRGTVRPQQGLEHLCSRLIAEGYVRPPHDLRRMQRALTERRAATLYGEPPPEAGFRPLHELDRVAQRVRSLVGTD